MVKTLIALVSFWFFISSAMGILSFNLPSCAFICISQRFATLTISVFLRSWHNVNARGESLSGLLSHHIKAWVSSSSFIYHLSRVVLVKVHQNHHWSIFLRHVTLQPV